MTTKAASVSTDVMPTKGQETELHATTACRVELTKGAVLYGAGGVLTATLVDQLLQANSLRWRQFSNGQHKLLLLGGTAHTHCRPPRAHTDTHVTLCTPVDHRLMVAVLCCAVLCVVVRV